VYDKTTIGAVAVACHEAGHALQHAYGYKAITARNAIVPAANFASHTSWILIIIGLFLGAQGAGNMGYIGDTIFNIGVVAFVLVLAFHIITLPVE
ncbi:zinc metallopeptidase, partial [Priestia megaterium]|uniref:zinc metallopeptidase n=1 Tax=Priestia megaterium TaxID=1404 RepID=UPI0028449082